MLLSTEDSKSKYAVISIIIAISIFTFILIRTAWIEDDAYITFRTVDNFIHGYGLTWNTSERVQVYTNPLWMFLASAFYFFIREIYFTSIFLCISITLLTLVIFAFKISKSVIATLLGITLFIFSQAFMDFSASGLENPLTHLLLAIFLFIFIKSKDNYDFKKLFLLSTIAALAAVNRLDTVVLFLPCLVYVYFKLPKLRGLYVVAIGFLPLIMWEGFSLFYYGFPFSNTTYAKVLGTGMSEKDLIIQGWHYFRNTIGYDHLTLLAVAAGLSIPFIRKQKNLVPVAAGIILYLILVTLIGGDFMRGRFFTAPLFVAVILISQHRFNFYRKVIIPVIFGAVIITGITTVDSPIYNDSNYVPHNLFDHGVSDQRGWYYQQTGLLKAQNNVEMPNHEWAKLGKKYRETGESPVELRGLGMAGYYAGPHIHIIDVLGLGDPLLARVYATNDPNWIVGHFLRPIPAGYIDTIKSGKNVIADKNLAAYYDKLSFIISGNLFDTSRLKEIWNMNIGKYNYLLDAYNKGAIPMVNYQDINTPKADGIAWDDLGNIILNHKGVEVNLGKQYNSKQVEISADMNNDYEIDYFNGQLRVASQTIIGKGGGAGLYTYQLDVPPDAIEKGYDNIRIIPTSGGDAKFSIGFIKVM